jgi:hypothetical protein
MLAPQTQADPTKEVSPAPERESTRSAQVFGQPVDPEAADGNKSVQESAAQEAAFGAGSSFTFGGGSSPSFGVKRRPSLSPKTGAANCGPSSSAMVAEGKPVAERPAGGLGQAEGHETLTPARFGKADAAPVFGAQCRPPRPVALPMNGTQV